MNQHNTKKQKGEMAEANKKGSKVDAIVPTFEETLLSMAHGKEKEANIENICFEELEDNFDDTMDIVSDELVMGQMIGFPLLASSYWDKAGFIHELKKQWNIDVIPDVQPEDEIHGEEQLIFHEGDFTVAIRLAPVPVPDHEAERAARNNYMWQEATITAHKHEAHLVVIVFGVGKARERAELFVKVMTTLSITDNVIGLYTMGTVIDPAVYKDTASMLKNEKFPIYNLVWLGVYNDESGISGFTYGMNDLNQADIELLNSPLDPIEIRHILAEAATYIIVNEVDLSEVSTITLPNRGIYELVYSEGIGVPGFTVKLNKI